MVKQRVEQVLAQEVTRRQFLVHAGLALLAVVGLPALLRALEVGGRHPDGAGGYGGSSYGGQANKP
ncbi:MAG TPA: twin-arginine translocation signal domain-containing protein [Candidatus Saccharimonas sp.]|nr:twin-arginine translocation signal domain-containing protein [Candidatus Saccharimonas sp.]